MRTESINALACTGFAAIRRAGESCKDRLGLLRREEPEDLDGSKDAHGEWASEETAFGGSYCEQVASRVNMACGQRVGEFVSQVSERIERFVEEVTEERSHLARVRGRIWKARATLAGRLAAVVVPLSGAKNENLRQALRPVLLERWASRARRRGLAAALKVQFDESYDQLVSDLAEMPLRADQAIADGIVKWLKSYSESFQKAEQTLAELRRLIVARCEVLDGFIGVVNQHLNGIPKELRDTAGEVKKHAIEEHMSRIRSAASAVEEVRSDVERAADVAGRSH